MIYRILSIFSLSAVRSFLRFFLFSDGSEKSSGASARASSAVISAVSAFSAAPAFSAALPSAVITACFGSSPACKARETALCPAFSPPCGSSAAAASTFIPFSARTSETSETSETSATVRAFPAFLLPERVFRFRFFFSAPPPFFR